MKQIDDLFLNAHYSDLSPSEQSLIEDLCSDESSFQQVKVLVTRSKEVLPENPPAHLLDVLHQTFDQMYSHPPVQRMRPKMLNLFTAVAVAASVLVFLSIYYFGVDNTPQKKLVKVERKQSPKNVKAPKLVPNPKPTQNPQLATVEPIAPLDYADISTVAPIEQVMDEPAPIASIEMEDAKQEGLEGSRSDEDAVLVTGNVASNTPKNNTYMWNAGDKRLASEQVVLAEVSMKKQNKSDSKRLNTSFMLKQIKPVY